MRSFTISFNPLIVIALSLALLACGGSASENVKEADIISAIDSYLENDPPASIAPLGGWSDEASSFPMDIVIPKQSLARAEQNFPTLFALADVGLLSITQGQVITENIFGKDEELPGLHVELTEEGALWYLPEQGRFAYAKLSVAQVEEIQKVNDVNITVTVDLEFESIADWTNKEAVLDAYPGMAEFLSNTPITKTFRLKFADKLWQVVPSPDDLL